MNITVVYNPQSGSAVSKSQLASYFKSAHITVDAWLNITEDETTTELSRLRQQDTIIAAVGGDGTITSVANYIRGGRAILAPLPGGTLNHFTKDIGINQDLKKAIKGLSRSKPRSVDVATVNGRVFLNNSSIGFYPTSLQVRKHFEDRLGKWPAAVIASLRALIYYKLYTVTIDNTTTKTPFVFVGNNVYHLDQMAARNSLTEGTLCLYVISSERRWVMLKLFFATLFNKLREQPELIEFYAKQATIYTNRSGINVATDGEVVRLSPPLNYELHAKGLRVIGNS